MGVVARSDRDKYSGWPPPQKPKQEPQPGAEAPRKRRKVEKVNDDNGA